jgi:hypothetical protein
MTRPLAFIIATALFAGCRGPNPAFDDPVIDAAADGHPTGGSGSGGSGTGGTGTGGSATGDGGAMAGGADGGTGGGAGSADSGAEPDLVQAPDLPAPGPDAVVDNRPASVPDGTSDLTSMDLAGDGGDGILHGLHADYFDEMTFINLAYSQTDPKLEFAWAKAAPDPRLSFTRGWSVRWTGKIKPRYSELYKLTAHAGDGVRVFIDGMQVINDWMPHMDRDASANVMLSGTRSHDIKVEYYFVSGWAVCRLLWSSPSQASEVVPSEAYTP